MTMDRPLSRPQRPSTHYVATDAQYPQRRVIDAVATVGAAEVMHLTGGRAMVTGTVGQITAHVARWRAEGRLVDTESPQPEGQGRYSLVVYLAPRTVTHRQPVPQFWTSRRKVVAAAAALALIAVLIWAMLVAVAWIAEHIIGVLVIAAVVIALSVKVGPRVCQTIVTVTHHR
jgi:hypothetical protein